MDTIDFLVVALSLLNFFLWLRHKSEMNEKSNYVVRRCYIQQDDGTWRTQNEIVEG
jgi:hypothetical protein